MKYSRGVWRKGAKAVAKAVSEGDNSASESLLPEITNCESQGFSTGRFPPMPRPSFDALRQLAASQAPGHACKSVLSWRDELGQEDAIAVLERDHETVRVAYRWRTAEDWRSTRLELTLQVARTATGGVYRMWRCPF